eukprot:COSAG02_NODE_2895_length_7786_cov_3.419930_3_plen_218_part_00
MLKSTSRRPTTCRTTALDHAHRPERFAMAWPAAVASEQLWRRPDRIPACRKARQSKRSGQSGLRATQGRMLRPARETGWKQAYGDVVRTGLSRANTCVSLTTWTAAGATLSTAMQAQVADATAPPHHPLAPGASQRRTDTTATANASPGGPRQPRPAAAPPSRRAASSSWRETHDSLQGSIRARARARARTCVRRAAGAGRRRGAVRLYRLLYIYAT